MKLGLDYHGVLDHKPQLFSELTNLLVSSGCEVHIITGEMDTPKLRQSLEALGIHYTHVFSISSYHKSIGTNMWFKDPDNPFIDQETWDKTKAEYCQRESIDLHIDDSRKYGKYFTTPFLLYRKGPSDE